jgi:ferrous iron transport protein B
MKRPSVQLPPDAPGVGPNDAPPGRFTAALLGNPNTGKTTLFNALSGLNQRVGNYPGVTVETKKGSMVCAGRPCTLIDLPGTYSLSPRSPDEMVAVDVILGRQAGEPRPDVLVCIVDASNLERNLYLTSQALEVGVPVVVALNMTDVAAAHGVRIDVPRLAEGLGVPVVPIQANKKRGLDELRSAVARAAGGAPPARGPAFPPAFEGEAAALQESLGEGVPAFLTRRLLLDAPCGQQGPTGGGGYTEQRLAAQLGPQLRTQVQQARQRMQEAGCAPAGLEARARYGWIRQATAGCVVRPASRPVTWTDRLDRLLTHRVWGTLVFLTVMFLVFQSIYTGARPLMKAIDAGKDLLGESVSAVLPAGEFTSLLVEGVIGGVGAVLVFLPQILILFAFIAVLEDCGYMARAAFLMDRVMSRCGLSGKSFIPMLSSVACAVPGIMATRVIEDRRDRLATIVTAPLMSCSARLPVYVLLIGAFLTDGYPVWMPGVTMFGLYALGLVLAPLVALALKRTLLKGQTPAFVMEMPGYKWPSVRVVLRRLFDSGWMFLRRAGTIILASMVLVWVLLNFPAGDYRARIAALNAPVQQEREQAKELEEKITSLREEEQALPADEETAGWFGLVRRRGATPQEQLQRARLQAEVAAAEGELAGLKKTLDPVDEQANALEAEWKRQSFLGRLGRAVEPAVRPLGWDWRVGVAVLASFPAREVVVSTLGIVYRQGKVDTEEIRNAKDPAGTDLGKALKDARWDDDPDRRVFTTPAALSLLVFFALCCQCASTLAVIRRETRTWAWPAFTFVYMTALAYVAALATFQVGTWLS